MSNTPHHGSPERNRAFCSRHPNAKPTPSNHNVAWYRTERPKWIAYLGGKCAHCGTEEELEFDHHVPRDWDPAKTSRWQRLRNYIKEIKAGKIRQLLCRSCNARKGYPEGQLELIERAQVEKRQKARNGALENEPF